MSNILFIIALTLWGEARGEGEEGMKMVASVIWNRAENRDMSLDDVCMQPRQFSSWDDGVISLNEDQLKSKEWRMCMMIAADMVEMKFVPITTADHFYNPETASPMWADKMKFVYKYGNHVFLKGR